MTTAPSPITPGQPNDQPAEQPTAATRPFLTAWPVPARAADLVRGTWAVSFLLAAVVLLVVLPLLVHLTGVHLASRR